MKGINPHGQLLDILTQACIATLLCPGTLDLWMPSLKIRLILLSWVI